MTEYWANVKNVKICGKCVLVNLFADGEQFASAIYARNTTTQVEAVSDLARKNDLSIDLSNVVACLDGITQFRLTENN